VTKIERNAGDIDACWLLIWFFTILLL